MTWRSTFVVRKRFEQTLGRRSTWSRADWGVVPLGSARGDSFELPVWNLRAPMSINPGSQPSIAAAASWVSVTLPTTSAINQRLIKLLVEFSPCKTRKRYTYFGISPELASHTHDGCGGRAQIRYQEGAILPSVTGMYFRNHPVLLTDNPHSRDRGRQASLSVPGLTLPPHLKVYM